MKKCKKTNIGNTPKKKITSKTHVLKNLSKRVLLEKDKILCKVALNRLNRKLVKNNFNDLIDIFNSSMHEIDLPKATDEYGYMLPIECMMVLEMACRKKRIDFKKVNMASMHGDTNLMIEFMAKKLLLNYAIEAVYELWDLACDPYKREYFKGSIIPSE